MPAVEITWQAPEFEYRPKRISWYWGSIALSLLILAFAVWEKNFLFAIFILCAEILAIVWGSRTPGLVDFKLTEEGLTIAGSREYLFRDLEYFSIDENAEGESPQLTLVSKKKWRSAPRIALPKDTREEIEKTLKLFLAQKDPEPSFFENLERFFKF